MRSRRLHVAHRVLALGLAGTFVALLLAALTAAGRAEDDYAEQIAAWRQRRLERLLADTGYLTLAGLYWLREGDNTVGSDPHADVVLPAGKAPAHLGVLHHAGGRTTLRVTADTAVRVGDTVVGPGGVPEIVLGSDAVVQLGDVSFWVIRRGKRYAIRMRDLDSPVRKSFTRIDTYPTDPAWRIVARWEPFDPPRKIAIASIVGTVDTLPVPGRLHFEVDGVACSLDPVIEQPGDTSYFIMFRDQTSGDETYGNGRFIYVDPPDASGHVVVDFNKAYNPPCAFSPFTTCPLPPPQNELPVAVRAGEKRYEGPTGAH